MSARDRLNNQIYQAIKRLLGASRSEFSRCRAMRSSNFSALAMVRMRPTMPFRHLGCGCGVEGHALCVGNKCHGRPCPSKREVVQSRNFPSLAGANHARPTTRPAIAADPKHLGARIGITAVARSVTVLVIDRLIDNYPNEA